MKNIYFTSMYFLFVVIFINELFSVNQNLYILLTSIGILLFLISSLSLTRGFQLYVSLISLAVGHMIFLGYNLDFAAWHGSLTKGIGMPVLFVAIPLITFPIKYGNYLQAVEGYVASKREKPIFLFSILTIIHLFLSIVLNVASVTTLQKLLDKIELPKKYLARLYATGYSSYMVFSPYDGVVNMVLIFTATRYSDYFLGSLSMVILIISAASVFLKTDKKLLQDLQCSLASLEDRQVDKKVYELLLHIMVLIFLAFLGDRYIPFSNQLYTIAVIIIFYSTLWGFLLKALNKYKEELKGYSENLLGCKSFLPFLISAGFLGSMVSYTPLKDGIGNLLLALDSLPLFFIIQLFMVFTMFLSLCGINMMITVTTLAFTVTPAVIGLSNEAFALTLLTCWYMAMSISPFVPFAVIVADSIGDKPVNVTFKYNLRFSLVMLLLAPMVILLFNYFTL